MRKILGPVLLGLGGFLIVIGVLALVWAPGVIKKTPVDVNTTTNLEGTVKKLDTSTGELVENPVKVQSITKTDTDLSDDNDDIWFSTSCVVIDTDDAPDCVDGNDPRLVSASTDVFATDRVSGLAVNDAKGLPDDATPHEGLMNKWPFDSKKKDYSYWDGTIGRAVPAVYDRTATLDGIKCYVYTVTVKDEPIEIGEGINGTYSNVVEIWVEPKTGAIQQQTQDQQRYLDNGDQVLDLKIGFTDKQIKESADDARTNMGQLKLLLFWVPLIGFVVGAIAIIVGVLLVLRRPQPKHDAHAAERPLAGSRS